MEEVMQVRIAQGVKGVVDVPITSLPPSAQWLLGLSLSRTSAEIVSAGERPEHFIRGVRGLTPDGFGMARPIKEYVCPAFAAAAIPDR